jgi:hypothetical protein
LETFFEVKYGEFEVYRHLKWFIDLVFAVFFRSIKAEDRFAAFVSLRIRNDCACLGVLNMHSTS